METSRDVIFDEAFMLKQNEAKTCDDSPHEKLTVEMEFDENSSPNDESDVEINPQQQQEELYSIAKGREKRVHKAPQRYGFEDMISFALLTNGGYPSTFKEATNRKDNDKWLVAMSEEME